jgi:serine/threonine protein kinase
MTDRVLQVTLGGRIRVNIGDVKEVKLLEFLGGGGFGSVWKVVDLATQKFYTLKIIQNIRPGEVMAERVRMEAEVSINSEYIVPVIGLCKWNENTFLILFAYFRSRSLDHLIAADSLNGEQRRVIFKQILLGVADAHRHNVIHRDLKPANVLVGDGCKVKLIDFGVSKFKGRQITLDGQIIGTLPYIAPEIIIDGAKNVDARADIYSAGQLFYELITGRHFWMNKGWRELKDFVAFLQRVPRPTEIMELDGFSCDLFVNAGEVLLSMVKINPADRFTSVEQIQRALGLIPTFYPALRLPLRHPMLIIESGTNRNTHTAVSVEEGGFATYGRADFAGDDETVSREHIEFMHKGGKYFVRDLESKNGTMLAGVTLLPFRWYAVAHADRIKLGDLFLRFAMTQGA